MNPIAAGGYFWVVFTTPRDYGNEMVAPGTTEPDDPTYANRKQLWVAAVDSTVGAVDPSHPPFWLPGQDATTANMFGYWALAPCKPTTAADGGGPSSCSAGFECCSGYCRDTGKGPVCSSTNGGCSAEGDKCTMSSDCCNSSDVCSGGYCEPSAPK